MIKWNSFSRDRLIPYGAGARWLPSSGPSNQLNDVPATTLLSSFDPVVQFYTFGQVLQFLPTIRRDSPWKRRHSLHQPRTFYYYSV